MDKCLQTLYSLYGRKRVVEDSKIILTVSVLTSKIEVVKSGACVAIECSRSASLLYYLLDRKILNYSKNKYFHF